MEIKRAQDLIVELKKAKTENEVTYPRIIDMMEANGKPVSLTTLRRVFADGSELNAGSFNYETTLLPIAEVLLNIEDVPTPEDSPQARQIDALKAVIHCQNEELVRLHELKELLLNRVAFLDRQIRIKDRRIDNKDRLVNCLLEKCVDGLELSAINWDMDEKDFDAE